MVFPAVLACAVLAAAPLQAGVSLADAARHNDVSSALDLLQSGADVNVAHSDGATALHWASHHDNVELVAALIRHGADVDTTNIYGSSPLAEGAANGSTRVVELLLKAGADVEARNPEGQTALMLAARTSSVDSAEVLLRHGADINAREAWRNQTALMWAAARRQPEMVAMLASQGADLDTRATVNEWPRQVSAEPRALYRLSGGLTALHYAAREGCFGCVVALIDAGADLNLPDPDGISPLFMAIDNMHFDVATYMLDAGANPNSLDWWGRTPLYAAVDVNTVPRGGNPDRPSLDSTTSADIIRALLAAGANPNTQLYRLARYRSPGFDRGGDIILTTGATPLLRAAKAFDVVAMKLLIEHGALVDLPNVMGVTPIMAAAGMGATLRDTRGNYSTSDVQRRSIASLKLLLDAGGEVDSRVRFRSGRTGHIARSAAMQGREGQTALFAAASWGWEAVVAYLVERGARVDVIDAAGMTLLDAARGLAGGTGDDHSDLAALVQQLHFDSGPAR